MVYFIIAAALCNVVIGIMMIVKTENKPTTIQLQGKVDSLQSELNIMSIEKGRYEYMIDVIRDNDSIKVDSLLKNIE